jgi:hypothetical protein
MSNNNFDQEDYEENFYNCNIVGEDNYEEDDMDFEEEFEKYDKNHKKSHTSQITNELSDEEEEEEGEINFNLEIPSFSTKDFEDDYENYDIKNELHYSYSILDKDTKDVIEYCIENIDDKHTSPLLIKYTHLRKKYYVYSFSKKKESLYVFKKALLDKHKHNPYLKKILEFIKNVETLYTYKFYRRLRQQIRNSINTSFNSNYGILSVKKEEAVSFQRNDDPRNLLKMEAESYAVEGFLIALRKYEVNKNASLSTYIHQWLKSKISHYVEKGSSLNKAKKNNNALVDFNLEDREKEDFSFGKFDHIQYENQQFQSNNEESHSYSFDYFDFEKNEVKILDILKFFCDHKDIFHHYEQLILKYDLLLDYYVVILNTGRYPEVEKCFYESFNENVDILNNNYNFDIKEFFELNNYNDLPLLLKSYLNLGHDKHLVVRRSLKQKVHSILNKLFYQVEE